MAESLSLSWDAYQNNICSGLSVLQQRGEYVDMTLAADGHHVKVHQMVVSLVSPYIKNLIATAQCPHPVIFLNNMSYTILCAILEYIYTGEVLIPKDSLPDLIAAGRALHIRGLKEMDNAGDPESEDIKKESLSQNTHKETKKDNSNHREKREPISKVFVNSNYDNVDMDKECLEESNRSTTQNEETFNMTNDSNPLAVYKNKEYGSTSRIQYSISNQGNMQVVVNRYIYNLKYVQKNLNRYWRCVDYATKKCPANLHTNNKNMVLKRKCSHNHPFHDTRILKKIRLGVIFNAFNEAKDQAESKKVKDAIEIISTDKSKSETDDYE